MKTQSQMAFSHETIDANPPSGRLGICLATDLTGNGRDDVIIGGLGASWEARSFETPIGVRLPNRRGFREIVESSPNLFWYENPGWSRHAIADVPLDVGADLADIDGDGRVDVVAGQGIHQSNIYWFEQPSEPRERWNKHKITDIFEKYHDIVVADVDDDGDPEVIGLSQRSETVFYYDIPDDPYQSPWPEENLHIVADDLRLEGLAVVDIDGDGTTELIAGTYVFRRPSNPGGTWERERIVSGWDDTRVAVADLDGDGDLEVVFSEGDSPVYGTHPGRIGWFDQPKWTPTVLEKELFCPHSVAIADFTGDGRPDIFVGEMSLGRHDDPRHLLFVNEGSGEFTAQVVARGIATHQATVADLTGNRIPDIVGKSYESGGNHVDAWYNEKNP